MTEARHPSAGSGDAGRILIPFGGSEDVLAEQLDAARRLGADDLVVDFGDAETVSSTVLETLLRSARELGRRHGRLAVVCCRPSLERLLRITLLSRTFAVHRTLESALHRPA